MTAQTVTTAVATRDQGPTAMIEQYRDDFAQVLPSHIKPATWVRLAVGALRRDEKLRAAATENPASLMVALLDAARMGLEPGTPEYYLTPRKVKGQLEVLGIPGYQGEVEMIYRAGAVSSVIIECVRANDKFTYAPGRDERPLHEIDWDSEDRGPLRLAYGYAIMKDGATSKVVIVNKTRIARAKSASQGSDSDYSPWKRDEEAMWAKTAAHDLRKWVPTSSEYRKEALRAIAEVAAHPTVQSLPPRQVDTDTGEVIEGELLENCSECGQPQGYHDDGCTA